MAARPRHSRGSTAGPADRYSACHGRLGSSRPAWVPPRRSETPAMSRPWPSVSPYPNSYENHERRVTNTGDAQTRVTYGECMYSKGDHRCSSRSLADPDHVLRLVAARIRSPRPSAFVARRLGRHRRSYVGGHRRQSAMADAGSHPRLAGTRQRAHRRVAATTRPTANPQELEAIMTGVRGSLCTAGRLGG